MQLLNCTQGYIVDIGAHDGVYLSNSYNLLINSTNSYKGILIEANEERFKNLQNLYSNNKEVITLNHLVSFQGIYFHLLIHSRTHSLMIKVTIH